ncbi:branched-chain amino acid aminotransferase [Candidatus Parcubacteria bacterium]|nr:branched-chain amino acid aminotransferase [Candidatus Parcubacteria bacterium]
MPNLDWKNLPFAYHKTDYNIRCYFKDGEWGKIEKSDSEYLQMHTAAGCLHYGQEAFEGMKAFCGKDGKIRIFRWEENAERLNRSAEEIFMPEIPREIFKQAVFSAVEMNKKFVPPYDSDASLYIRPLLIGSGAQLGLHPTKEYLFLVFVNPVGPYLLGFNPIDILIDRDRDRAAPLGVGHIKAGGNYAASFKSLIKAEKQGYHSVMFLDPKEKKYIDECGPANFFAIKGNTYITPKSKSILASITNKSLMKLAKEIGMKVEQRKIRVEELAEFDEAGSCGTAAVISPIKKIVDSAAGKTYEFCKDGKPGPISTKLYNSLRAIQYGDEEDKFNWTTIV